MTNSTPRRIRQVFQTALVVAGLAVTQLTDAQVAPSPAETAAYRGLHAAAARGDVAAIERQAAMVQTWDAPSGDAYRALSTLALRLAGH